MPAIIEELPTSFEHFRKKVHRRLTNFFKMPFNDLNDE
jgi:hypothetical protein